MNRLEELLYRCAPYPIQNLLLSAYGAYLKSIRYGSAYLQSLESLAGMEDASSEQIERCQEEKLNQIVRGAIASVPYYKSKYMHLLRSKEHFTRHNLAQHFPILEKRYVKDHLGDFRSEAVSPSRCVTVFTSGTTGSPLEVTATKRAVAENFAFFSNFLKSNKLDPFAWSVTFGGRLILPKSQSRPPFWRCNYAMRTWLFSSYHIAESNIAAYLAQLERIQPTYIDSYPSSIYAIARYIVERKVVHSVRPSAIVTSSEVLTFQQRQIIQEAFNCPVIDQYGSAEMVVFAQQCSFGSYHVHPLYGVTEIVDEHGATCKSGQIGDLVVTGLINDAMPLLRYRIGDSAAFRELPCPCGSCFPALEGILGRNDDYIVTPEGNHVGRLDPLFKGLRGIIEAQVIQESIEELEVLVVPGDGFGDTARQKLVSSIRDRVGAGIEINVRLVESIPRGANGKFRTVISRVKRASLQ